MHLKALEVNGFKSFAEKVRIDFTRGITSVVGPNGSGKSNILDAILWVLGEQSYKNIRAKASTDVIFSGGKNRKAKSFAEVTLIVDNSDGVLALDTEEIRITRHITDKSENTYYINNDKCRLKDIQELFMDTGVGKSAYSVIGQGKVERIISSSNQEIRSIIEEAAGIKKIKLRKSEAEKKLDNVKIEIDKIAYVEKELGNNLKNITKQAEKAMKFNEYTKEKDELYKAILVKELKDRKEDFESVNEKEKVLRDRIEFLQEKFINSEKDLEETLGKREEANEEYEVKNSENKEFKEELELLVNEKVRLTERLSSLKKEIWEKSENIVSLEKKEDNKKSELDELELKIKELESYIENEEHSHEEDNLYLDDLEEKFYKLEEELRKSKEKVLDYEVDRVKFLNNIEEANKKEKSIEKRVADLEREKEEFLKENSRNTKELEVAQGKKIELEDKNSKLKEKRVEIYNRKKEVEQELKKVINQRDEADYKWRNKNSKYENLKRTDENNEGFFKSVKLIMKEGINGVKGPILSLVEIPDKFMKAIESSIGNGLQDIVVENSSHAKFCINFLKDKKGGRASFLPLDRIKPSSLSYNFREDKIYGTANELIKFDYSIKKAVDFIFSKVLIVENMDTALMVQQKGTFRGTIVTLEGDIVSTTGRITGGEKLKSASSVIFERRKEIKELEDQLVVVKQEYDDLLMESDRLGKINDKLESELESLVEEQEMLQEERETQSENYNKLALLVTQSEKNLELVNFEIKEIKESLADYENMGRFAKEEIEKINKNLEELNKHNSDLEAKRVEERELLEKIRKENSGKQMVYVAKMEEKKQISRSIASLKLTLSEISEEIEKADEYIKKAKEEQVETDNTIGEIDDKIGEKEELYKGKIDNLTDIRATIKNLEEEEKRLIVEIKNVETEIVKEEGKVVSIVEKVQKVSYQIENLKSKLEELVEVEDIELKQDLKEAKKLLGDIEVKIKALGYVNLLAVEEYESAKEKYDFIHNQKTDLVTSKKNLENLIEEIEHNIKNSFYDAFREINNNFGQMCKDILNNSQGSLKLIDEANLLESGVELMVKYKNKKSQTLSLLSGGEKSMVAVALIMAIFMYKPSPFTFFDEIEAALDESNTKRLLKKLKEFTEKSQFILITHNKHTMKESDTLYGVTMNKEIGESKILSVKL